MTMSREATRWRKSSLSGQDTECVELAHTGDAVRDSKNPTGPTLTINSRDLLAVIKSGRLDR